MTAADPLEALRDLMARRIQELGPVVYGGAVEVVANIAIQAIAEHMGGSYTILRDEDLPTSLEVVYDVGDGIEDGISRLSMLEKIADVGGDNVSLGHDVRYRGFYVEITYSIDGVYLRIPYLGWSPTLVLLDSNGAKSVQLLRDLDTLLDAVRAEHDPEDRDPEDTTTEGNPS